MKQAIRLLVKPGAFFNQLQWSAHHWIILVTFLGLAVVETQVGTQANLYNVYANVLQSHLGVDIKSALWIITFAKLIILMAGAYAISTVVWFVGALFGRASSQRVLFRRLAVVFTVFLAGYTASHLAFSFVTLFFYGWGIVLGYFAIREQFELNHLETVVVGLFALFLVTSSWQFTNNIFETVAVKSQLAVKPQATSATQRPRIGPRH